MNIKITRMTEDELKNLVEEHKQLSPVREVKPDTLETIKHYVEDGWQPGGFLTAVLANDLMNALGKADSYNRASIFEISCVVYNDIPSNCHGSYEIVNKWIENGGLNGLRKKAETVRAEGSDEG